MERILEKLITDQFHQVKLFSNYEKYGWKGDSLPKKYRGRVTIHGAGGTGSQESGEDLASNFLNCAKMKVVVKWKLQRE